MSPGSMEQLCKQDKTVREQTRMHYDLDVCFDNLPLDEKRKDTSPLNTMLKILYEFEGVRIYSLNKR